MKLLFAVPMVPPETSDSAAYAKKCAMRLSLSDDITVVTYANAIEPISGVRCIAVPKQRPLAERLVAYVIAIWKAAKEQDVIMAQSAMASALPAWIVASLRRIPFVIQFGEDEVWERAVHAKITTASPEKFFHERLRGRLRINRAIQRFLVRRASMTVVSTDGYQNMLVKNMGVDAKRVVVNPLPAPDAVILPFNVERKPRQICLMGKPFLSESDEVVVRAIAKLDEQYADVKLLCCGDGGEEKKLQRLAEELGIAHRIVVLGDVTSAESWFVRRSSAAMIVSDMVHTHAMDTVVAGWSADVPVVAVSDDACDGIVCATVDALSKTIARVLDDEPLRMSLVAQGRRMVRETYTWDAHITRLNFLQSL